MRENNKEKMKDLSKYYDFLKQVLDTINSARYRAYRAINRYNIEQNFELGKIIIENQEANQWGKSIVETLSKDINKTIDGLKGYSSGNLWRMRQFYLEYKGDQELLELTHKIPWGQNLEIMHKIKDREERKYYLISTDKLAWSRTILLNQIKADAYKHHLLNAKQSNFERVLPTHLSEQANQALKSEYNLDFLGVTKPIHERELENRLIEKIRDLILELGYGFSFIGSQYKLKLSKKEYYVDLLFYHRFLKCLVAIELKTVEFKPEFSGKMNFYLELLDEHEKQKEDNPSIGIILCPTKDDLEVEYALRISSKPIGVSEYKLTKELPSELKGKVPTSQEMKKMLNKAKLNIDIERK